MRTKILPIGRNVGVAKRKSTYNEVSADFITENKGENIKVFLLGNVSLTG